MYVCMYVCRHTQDLLPEAGAWTYDLQLQVVSEARGAVHPHQHRVLQVRAEAHCQAVRARARAVVGGPRVSD